MRNRTLAFTTLAGALLAGACMDSPSGPVTSAMRSDASSAASADRDGGPVAGPGSIAFVSTYAGNPDIWVMNRGETNPYGGAPGRNLTADNLGVDQSPDWSKDGRIAFSSARDGNTDSQIYVMHRDGSDPMRVTYSGVADNQPAWSPNGKEIAFVRGAIPSREIMVISLADGAERQLTHAGDNYHPAWSPDGSRIIFSSDRNGDPEHADPGEAGANLGVHDIYIMDASAGDNAPLTRVTNNPTSLDGEPSFAPNGQLIAFRTRRNTAVDPDGVVRHWCTIAVANPDGSDIRYLTPKPAEVMSTQWCNAFPAWSRDGKTIYFHSVRSGHPVDIYSVGVDGTNLRRISYDDAAETAPAVR